jgi:hypothetical protein
VLINVIGADTWVFGSIRFGVGDGHVVTPGLSTLHLSSEAGSLHQVELWLFSDFIDPWTRTSFF